jgi:glycosyltransferase involved in cell wall biosynthesis
MKIALVHDFLAEYGGAERVVEVIHEVWPWVPMYVAFVNFEGLGPHKERVRKWDIRTSWAQKIPFFKKLYSPLRFLALRIFESFDLSDFEVVISSTNMYMAKGVKTRKDQLHVCYCHTPPRSLYGYPTRMDWKKHWWTRVYGTIVNHFMLMDDFASAQRPDFFVANSLETQRRIKKFYRRDSAVIYPPVETEKFRGVSGKRGDYYLFVGRLAVAKGADLAIGACNKLKLPLWVVGRGAEQSWLKDLAGPTIEFLGEVSDEELVKIYAGCKALIFPSLEEDFGIVPVEAMAAGKPVIALKQGGVVESVVPGKTGVFFGEATVESLVEVLKKFNLNKFKAEDCKNQAEKFGKERFMREMREFVEAKYRMVKKNFK